MPGSLNDINILDRSLVFVALAEGHAPPINYIINKHEYIMGYYLASKQESARKDVERAFGVLKSRFAIVR